MAPIVERKAVNVNVGAVTGACLPITKAQALWYAATSMKRHRRTPLAERWNLGFIGALVLAVVVSGSYLAIQHFSHAYGGGGPQVWVYANPSVNNVCFLVDMSNDSINWVTNYEYPPRCTGVAPSGYASTTGAYMMDSTYSYYRLIFYSAPSGYSFKDWRLSNGQTTTGNSISFSNNIPSVYIDLNAPPPPTPPSGPSLGVTSHTTTSVGLGWSGGSAGSYGSVSGYSVLRNGAVIANLAAGTTSYTAGSLACNTGYYFMIQLKTSGGASANSNQVYQVTSACPTPVPTPAPSSAPPKSSTPAPTSAPAPSKTGGSGGVKTPSPATSSGSQPAAPAAPADTTPPPAPGNFVASVDDGQVGISLDWDASSDPSGIAGYNLDRSTDNKTWAPLTPQLSDTGYDDQDTKFGTHYFYRVRAVDGAGNPSAYAYVDAATGQFQANSSGDSGLTLTSPDKLAVANLPAGAVTAQANCQVVSDQTEPKTDLSVVAGPYVLLCKDQDGNVIDSLDKSADWTINLQGKERQFTKLQAAQLDGGGRPTAVKTQFNQKTGVMTFSSTASGPFVVLGAVRHGLPWGSIISIIVILLLIFGGIGYLIYRQRNKQNYDDYLRRKYYDF